MLCGSINVIGVPAIQNYLENLILSLPLELWSTSSLEPAHRFRN